jgi:transposase
MGGSMQILEIAGDLREQGMGFEEIADKLDVKYDWLRKTYHRHYGKSTKNISDQDVVTLYREYLSQDRTFLEFIADHFPDRPRSTIRSQVERYGLSIRYWEATKKSWEAVIESIT